MSNKKTQKVDIETGEVIAVYYNTVRNYRERIHEKRYESNYSPSMTIPGQTLTNREMVSRFASGLPLDSSRIPMYHGDETDVMDMTEWKKLDLSERQDYLEKIRQQKSEIEKNLRKQADEQIKKRRDAEDNAYYEARLKRESKEKENRNSDSSKQ